ncbi:MAG TPA: hypothetical protein VK548_20125 [Candidatus Acidoferrum sp.]|nr:hypothetical protein [Candidatus Acidoferrum sp.]
MAMGFALVLAALWLVMPSSAAAAQCRFTVSGNVRVTVDDRLAVLKGRNTDFALSGAMVKVSGRRNGPFVEWGTVAAGPAGSFSVEQWRNCGSKHRYRVEIKFQDKDVMIANNGISPSFKIHQDGSDRSGTSVPLGTLSFGAGAANDLGDGIARAHAQLWVIAKLTRQTLDGLGQGFGARRLKIHYPTVLPTHADVVTNDVYLQRRPQANPPKDDLFGGGGESIVVHESMHIWAFEHTKPLSGGEFSLIWNLPGGTHEQRELVGTAFNEGFAEYAKDKLFETMFPAVPRRLPFNRRFLSCSKNLVTLDDVQHNDDGWTSILHTLTTPELHNFDFGVATPCSGPPDVIGQIAGAPLSGCTSPDVTFRQILALFDRHSPEFPDKLSLSDMNINGFLDRAIKVIGGTLTGKAPMYRAVASPGGTQQPRDFLCQ